ncbi:protein phosphatase 1 regulatory subunit 3A isoform X2 [Engraulis encrasicolus]|uniref:protein phosphatase 1 regulatory subunit 3A isoform X2 n=1 Tax=Engraulis encrasicolus TaxID=184585 RepID=UPI002FCF4FC4
MSAEELRLRGDSSSNITAAMPLERATWPQCPAKDKGEEERDGEEEVDGEERWQSKFISKQKEGKGVEEEEVEMDDDEPWQFTGPSAGGSPNQSDESEPESPPAFIRRKVSFADAFGLDLVYVKEFSNQTSDDKVEDLLCGLDVDEYYLSCVFTLPTSPQVLAETVEERKVALESLELMPGTTTLRGTVRVANLCFDKAVYVRTTYDSWGSHFDLLTEYVPGSSDRESDGFSFKLTLVPPLDAAGIRVEFCLRYESAVGEFWDSNNGQNYTLYCKRREHLIPESKGKRREEEEEEEKAKEMEIEKERLKEKKKKVPKVKSTRSCLKRPSKKTSPEPDPVVVSGTAEIPDTVSQRAARPASKTVDSANKRADEERLQKSLKHDVLYNIGEMTLKA